MPTVNRLDRILIAAAYRLRESDLLLPVRITTSPRPDPWDADSNTVFFCGHGEASELAYLAQSGEVNMSGRALWETQKKGIRGEIASANLIRDHNFAAEVWAYTALAQVIRLGEFANLRAWGLTHKEGNIRVLMRDSVFGTPWRTRSTWILPCSGGEDLFDLPAVDHSEHRPDLDHQLGDHLACCVAMVLLHWRIVWFNPPGETPDPRNEVPEGGP